MSGCGVSTRARYRRRISLLVACAMSRKIRFGRGLLRARTAIRSAQRVNSDWTQCRRTSEIDSLNRTSGSDSGRREPGHLCPGTEAHVDRLQARAFFRLASKGPRLKPLRSVAIQGHKCPCSLRVRASREWAGFQGVGAEQQIPRRERQTERQWQKQGWLLRPRTLPLASAPGAEIAEARNRLLQQHQDIASPLSNTCSLPVEFLQHGLRIKVVLVHQEFVGGQDSDLVRC